MTNKITNYVNYVILIISLFGQSSKGFSQGWDLGKGYPYLTEYPNESTGGGGYNWAMEWEDSGVAYIGRENLWRWDGFTWDRVGPARLNMVKSLAFDGQNKLWVGSYGEIGIFDTKTMEYETVLNEIPGVEKPIRDVWKFKIESSSTWVALSQSLLKINENGEVKVWDFNGEHRVLFYFIDNSVYAHEVNVGLWKITDGKKKLFNTDERLSSLSLIYLNKTDNNKLLGISSSGIFSIENTENGKVDLNSFSIDRIDHLSSARYLGNNFYLLGSIGNGVFIVNRQGELVISYPSESSLGSSLILGMEFDRDENCWVLGNQSIWCFYFGYPLGMVRHDYDSMGGFINAIEKNEDGIMISKESSSVYLKRQRNGIYSEVFERLGRGSNNVFYGEGIVFDDYDKLCFYGFEEQVRTFAFESKIINFDIDTSRGIVFTLVGDDLHAYKITNEGRIKLIRLDSFKGDAELLVIKNAENGDTWAYDGLERLFRIQYTPAGGIGMEEVEGPLGWREAAGEVLMTGAGPLLVGEGGKLWKWVEGRWRGGEGGLSWGEVRAGDFRWEGEELRGWMLVGGGEWEGTRMVEIRWGGEKGLRERWVPWPTMEELGEIYNMEVTEEGIFYIGGVRGILVADGRLEEQLKVPGRPILWAGRGGRQAEERRAARYGGERIRFRYTVAGGDRLYPIRYQTRLLGLEEGWSERTEETTRAYGHIVEGRYTFEVRAVDPFGRVSEVARQSLVVTPPWFRTGWAYGGYLLVAGLGIWGWVRYRERSLRLRQAELEETVRERTEELQRANTFKDEFIANMSHEIRNPLNGVIGLIRQLSSRAAPPPEYLRSLRSAADYLQTTVEDVLEFSRLQTGVIPVDMGEVDLESTVDGVVQIYRSKAEAKGLKLVSRVENAGDLVVITDGKKLAQILGNLTNNAVKFTESGKVSLGVKVEGDQPGEGVLKLWVQDTGIGISDADQERILGKFVRVEGKSRQGGTGLGLALVAGFVERLGGELQVRSTPGVGSSFIVSLPIELREPQDAKDGIPDVEPLGGLRILGIEDIEYNRLLLESVLAEAGCRVMLEEEGVAGLARARGGDWDVLLVDWDLPGMNGLEITRALRREGHEGIIIGMTAFATPEVRDNCLTAGMNAFITKPIAKERLWALLAEYGQATTGKGSGTYGETAGEFSREEWGRSDGEQPGTFRTTAAEPVYLNGRGLLGEMDDWETHKERWSELFATYWQNLAEAMRTADTDMEAVRRAAHKLLGHLSMVDLAILPEVVQELLVAAHEENPERMEACWQDLQRRRRAFEEEWEKG